MAGTSDVYRWDGSRFSPYLIIPSTNAYALTLSDVPCRTTSVDGALTLTLTLTFYPYPYLLPLPLP